LTDPPDLAESARPADPLAEVLAAVRLAGAIFLRAECTAPWAYESPPPDALTAILQPGAKRLILFHIVAEGRCWIGLKRGSNDVVLRYIQKSGLVGIANEDGKTFQLSRPGEARLLTTTLARLDCADAGGRPDLLRSALHPLSLLGRHAGPGRRRHHLQPAAQGDRRPGRPDRSRPVRDLERERVAAQPPPLRAGTARRCAVPARAGTIGP
jgi:hypothetical protein